MHFNLNPHLSEVFLKKAPIHRPIDIYIGKRLRRRREEIGVCCKYLAQKTMLNEAKIKAFENGSTRIGSHDLLSISEVLDVNIGYFYSE